MSSGQVSAWSCGRTHAAAEVDAGDDVAPLVGSAHLQVAADAPVELDEVVGLQQHVVELDERQLLLALEPHARRVHRQHAIDREVLADIAQELDVVERRQPLGVVDHDGIGLALAEVEELGKDRLDAVLVGVDLLDRADRARLIAPGRIADARGAPAHQRNRLVAGLLQPVQHHDRDQAADVERRRGAIIADVCDNLALGGQCIEASHVRALVNEATLCQDAKKVGFGRRHRVRAAAAAPPLVNRLI